MSRKDPYSEDDSLEDDTYRNTDFEDDWDGTDVESDLSIQSTGSASAECSSAQQSHASARRRIEELAEERLLRSHVDYDL